MPAGNSGLLQVGWDGGDAKGRNFFLPSYRLDRKAFHLCRPDSKPRTVSGNQFKPTVQLTYKKMNY